jgi:hypothetical protein
VLAVCLFPQVAQVVLLLVSLRLSYQEEELKRGKEEVRKWQRSQKEKKRITKKRNNKKKSSKYRLFLFLIPIGAVAAGAGVTGISKIDSGGGGSEVKRATSSVKDGGRPSWCSSAIKR